MIAIIDYGMGNLRSVQKALEKVGAQAIITHDPLDLKKAKKIVLPGVGAMRPAMEKLSSLNLISSIKDSITTGKPFLGICLGLQLLFDKGLEGGEVKGLGVLKGCVERFPTKKSFKIPHMGWNQLKIQKKNCPILKGIEDNANVYFCHSYFVNPQEKDVVATTTPYTEEFTSCVWSHRNLKSEIPIPRCSAFGGTNAGDKIGLLENPDVTPVLRSVKDGTTGPIGKIVPNEVRPILQNNIFGVQFHPEKSQEIGLTILKNFVAI